MRLAYAGNSPYAGPPVVQGGGGDASYPNKPAGYTTSTTYDFSTTPPGNADTDQPIPAASGWYNIYNVGWTLTTDSGASGAKPSGSAPASPPSIWQGRWDPGSYGGGIIGQGSGHGIGNIFYYLPGGVNHIYISLRHAVDAAYDWHPISNKFLNIEAGPTAHLLLMQLNEGGNWCHCEQLGTSNFYIDPANTPGQVNNDAIPTGQWNHFEILIDLAAATWKVWLNGTLRTNASSVPFAVSQLSMVGFYAFRGGGGETLASTMYWYYDHIHLAW